MSNARNLARLVVDSNGAVNASNLGNAVPADGSITAAKLAVGAAASNIGDGSITAAKLSVGAAVSNIGDGSITSAKLAVGAAASNIGYTPANKAGDTFTGAVNVTGAIVATNNVTAYGSF
jgi:hypothetical protein